MGKRKATSIDDDAVDPNEKHRIANRLAQRAFRERKDNRIKELETQVEELLAAQQTPPAQSANTEKKIREMEESISKLVAENTELKQKLEAAQRHAPQPANNINETLAPATAETTVYSSMHYLEAPTRSMSASVSPMWNVSMAQMTHQSLSPVSNTPSTTTNLSSSSIMKPASALDLYGLPPIESFRAELKALPSLAGCASIDLFFDHFVDQSKYTDPFQIRRRIFGILKHKSKILDQCDMLDRLKAIEIIERAKKLNQIHVDHMYSHWGDMLVDPAALPDVDVTATNLQLNTFKQVIQLIPSLTRRQDLIKDMHKLFVAMMSAGDAVERVKLFFSLADVKNKVFAACESDEDRNRLALAMELGRQGNKAYVDDMFDQVEAVLNQPPLF